jgi:glutaredoxin
VPAARYYLAIGITWYKWRAGIAVTCLSEVQSRLFLPVPENPASASDCPFFLLEKLQLAALESTPMPDPRTVVVYSRKGCHLCEVVKESLHKLSRRGGFTWQEVDVDADAALRREFNDQVPVVFIDGRKAFKYHMDEQEFLRKLAS